MPLFRNNRISPAAQIALLLGAFFISGAAGLIHEVVWIRLLRHVMGNTTAAISTVLTTFMAGLALGSHFGGRWIDRHAAPLRVFAWLECGVALYCLILPPLIAATEPIYRPLYADGNGSTLLLGSVRFLICGTLLLVPASMMGATLPVLSRWLTAVPQRVGSAAGKLYAINTFGAVAGAASAGFLWIPELGVSRTILLGSSLNLTVALGAFLLYRATASTAPPPLAPAAVPLVGSLSHRPQARTLLLWGYACSGAAALAFEVAWTRVISLMIGTTVYAFSMILTGFILGLALGSAVMARFVDRIRRPFRVLAAIETAVGLSALLVVPVFGQLPFVLTGIISRFEGDFWRLQAVEFALIVAVLLAPTMLMGAAFPLASRLFLDSDGAVGRSVGTIYAANTVGGIAGAFLGGFVLIPLLGLQGTIFSAAGLCVLIGVAFLAANEELATSRKLSTGLSLLLVAAVTMTAIPSWQAQMLSFGPFMRGRRLPSGESRSFSAMKELSEREHVLFHKEGPSTTVTVKESDEGGRELWINGKADASTGDDMATQVLLAQLPMLLHPNPKEVLVIGLATGITVGSAGLHPVEHIDCVEIAPTMVEAAEYFREYNHDALRDERVRLLINDGRNHLALGSSRYDVIISEPTNPWVAGVADLFTQEFFELCRKRLEPGGVSCNWLPSYNLEVSAFKSVVHTFSSVFPHVTIWNTVGTDFLLIGSEQPLQLDPRELLRRAGGGAVAAELARVNIGSAEALLSRLIMDDAGARSFADGARLHTDDDTHIEFMAPRTFTSYTNVLPLLEAIYAHRRPGLDFLTGPDGERLARRVDAAIQAKQRVFLAEVDLFNGRQEEAIENLRVAASLNPADPGVQDNVEKNLNMARDYLERRQPTEAIFHYRIALRILPGAAEIHDQFAAVVQSQGDQALALNHYLEALRLYNETGRTEAASRAALRALALAEQAGDRQLADRLRALPVDTDRRNAPKTQ